MSITNLALAKNYSNIYFDDRDHELQGTLDGAEEFLANWLNRDDLADLTRDESPGRLKADVESLVLAVFDDRWRNKGRFIDGASLEENPLWMDAAHLYRLGLGV